MLRSAQAPWYKFVRPSILPVDVAEITTKLEYYKNDTFVRSELNNIFNYISILDIIFLFIILLFIFRNE